MMNGPKPMYRIFIVPEQLDRAKVNTRSPEVQSLLTSPPGLRPNSFGYCGLSKTQLTPEGIEGTGITAEQKIVLLENGYFELRCPLRNALFQWYKEESGYADADWLYPYTVQEMPLSFLKVAKHLYALCQVHTSLRLRQEYRNVAGFVLASGHPGNPMFARDAIPFEGKHIVARERTLDHDFIPGKIARQLVEEVYAHFGYGEDKIPLLDEVVTSELGAV